MVTAVDETSHEHSDVTVDFLNTVPDPLLVNIDSDDDDDEEKDDGKTDSDTENEDEEMKMKKKGERRRSGGCPAFVERASCRGKCSMFLS